MKRTISIALAFVGLLVGAGFATGAEVIQYFISFGSIGIVGAVISGLIMAGAGAVILGLGSYFLAEEHNRVFSNVSHPVMSKILDVAVTITLFAIGFVMLAGAGSTLEQQWGIPSWLGAAIMTAIVLITGMLDVDKVSGIISSITPLIIVAVLGVFIYTMFNWPSTDYAQLDAIAQQSESPVSPWWLSALNYNGLALILGVSMSLVIGGSHSDPKAAFRGGLAGGILYTFLLVAAAVVLYLNIGSVGQADVPMLALYDAISPVLSIIMVFIIFAMIYNTAIGMFYALGRRLTARDPSKYRPVFIAVTLVGYVVSFVGFDALMTYVYPILGYMGIVLVALLVIWYIKNRTAIGEENARRNRLRELAYAREHPEEEFTRADAREFHALAEESPLPTEEVKESVEKDTIAELIADDSVDYDGEENPDGTAAKV